MLAAGFGMAHGHRLGDGAAGSPYLIAPGVISPASTFSRAQAGGAQSTALNTSGVVQYYAADIARFNAAPQRLSAEGQRTNLYLNTAALSTQGVTVTAVLHSVSFYGTGTISFSGAFVGSLVGSGATVLSKIAFTTTAGTLTSTVSGSVTLAQLEVGPFASTYIPTTAAALTRGIDIARLTAAQFAARAPTGEMTVRVSGMFLGTEATAQTVFFTGSAGDSGTFDYLNIRRLASSTNLDMLLVRGNGVEALSATIGTVADNTMFRLAISVTVNGRIAASLNGGAVVVRTIATPPWGPAGMASFGVNYRAATPGDSMFGEIAYASLVAGAASDAALPGISAAIPTA